MDDAGQGRTTAAAVARHSLEKASEVKPSAAFPYCIGLVIRSSGWYESDSNRYARVSSATTQSWSVVGGT
ncbi:MAG: hypothetical protein LIQ30_09750 [Planctomycetes bacterium]|nr:hypothetical protein [Planctomycetota bacterium]